MIELPVVSVKSNYKQIENCQPNKKLTTSAVSIYDEIVNDGLSVVVDDSEEHELANVSPISKVTPTTSGNGGVQRNSPSRPVTKNPAASLLNRPPTRNHFKIPWTENEVETLKTGIELYGAGKWADVLKYGRGNFNPKRTSVDLKDKYRWLIKHNYL